MSETAIPRSAERFARKVGLSLDVRDSELTSVLVRRIRRRTWAAGIGGGVVAVVAGIVGMAVSGNAIWFILGGVFVGIGFGVAIATFTEDPGPAPASEPRVARAREVGLRDYLDPTELLSARVLPPLGLVLTVVGLAIPAVRDGSPAVLAAAAGLSVLGMLGLVLLEVGGRRILARPRRTASPAALAWEDALRASDLRELVTAPLAAGLYAAVLAGGSLLLPILDSLDPRTGSLVAAALVTVVVVGAVIAIIRSVPRRPAQHYLRRLWPEVAAQADAARTAHPQARP